MHRPQPKKRRFQRDMSAKVEEYRFIVGAPEEGARLDGFLASKLDWRSRVGVRELIEAGQVSVFEFEGGPPDKRRIRPSMRLRRLEEVLLSLDVTSRLEKDDVGALIPTIYEDSDLLVVNKPSGMSVYPNRQHPAGSLVELVHRGIVRSRNLVRVARGHWPEERDWMPSPCHRLDRDTTGVVVFAKNPKARSDLGRQFEERELQKVYVAAVLGVTTEGAGLIDAPLGPAPGSEVELRMAVRPDGQEAVTEWSRVGAGHDVSLLELRPRTGRQHQLRAHLASIGHPILGDKLYLGGNEVFLRSLQGGLEAEELEDLGMGRQALHALRLTFAHPSTSQPTTLHAPLWPDMVDLLAAPHEETSEEASKDPPKNQGESP